MVGADERRPRRFVRVLMVLVALGVVWYASAAVFRYFDGSIGRKTPVTVNVRSTGSVQVALQDEDWQPAESGLKLYAGDAVATRSGGDVVLSMFDGTRVRLDQSTDVEVVSSNDEVGGTSTLGLKVRSGRIFVSAPSIETYSGAITRSIETTEFSSTLPASTSALFASNFVNVLRASGQGVGVTVNAGTNPVLIVGEGQYFLLDGNAKSAIAQGADPYEFRDPVTSQLLRDDFLTSSYTLFSTNAAAPVVVGGASSSLGANEPLVVTSPENRAEIDAKTVKVAGRAGTLVAQLMVNGQPVSMAKDGTFSVDVSLGKEPTVVITVEAQDAQGIPLSKIERTVLNVFEVSVEPLRFKSPVGSGETLRTSQSVVEITGEAPAGTNGVVINEYRLQLYKPGSKTWSYLANAAYDNLKVGENIFTAYAVDADGNKSPSRSITIVYEPAGSGTGTSAPVSSEPPLKQNAPLTPGVLVVDKPAGGTSADTSEKEVVIEGRTSGDTSSISINGYTLSLYVAGKTTWNYIASTDLSTMKRGKNVYRVVARNKDGEILDILEYTINFKP